MKPDWLSRLTGPNEAASQEQAFAGLLQPFAAPGPCGCDVGSSELFLQVKEQLALISGLDTIRLEQDCCTLLQSEGKDIRPAVYLAYAWIRQTGWQGLADGLLFLTRLLTCFGDGLHPARSDVRNTTLTWLAGDTVLDRLDALPLPVGTLKTTIINRLDDLLQCCQQLTPPLNPALGALHARLQCEQPCSSSTEATPAQHTTAQTVSANTAIASAQALMDNLRAMAAYLRQQPQGAFAASRLVRVVRWDSVSYPPPHDSQYVTRLPAPRPELRQQLKRMLLQKQWHALLEKIEAAFLEAANHFWLDLQFLAWEAMGQLGDDYPQWRDTALSDVATMRNRLAGIEHLRFSDGSPFADDITQEWLACHAVVRNIEAGEALSTMHSPAGLSHSMASIQQEALSLAENQGLESALAWLQALPQPHGQREQVERLLLTSRLAELRNRPDIALGILNGLESLVSTPAISQWDPALAFDIKAAYQKLLRSRLGKKDLDKNANTIQLHRLQQELSLLDPLRAALLPVT